MTDRQDPLEQLLDVLVYAPLGIALEARELLPRLVEKGRRRLGGQVKVARMVGELAVRQGQKRAENALERLRQQQAAGRPAGARPADTPGNGSESPARSRVVPERPSHPPARGGAEDGASGLAIPGYDTLSASQVLPRLEGLSAAELEAVRAYEEGTRARKTVLSRIDQLRSP